MPIPTAAHILTVKGRRGYELTLKVVSVTQLIAKTDDRWRPDE